MNKNQDQYYLGEYIKELSYEKLTLEGIIYSFPKEQLGLVALKERLTDVNHALRNASSIMD